MSTATVPPRILVVEDDLTIAQAVASRLQAEGFDVRTVHDGPSAVAAAAEWQPELLVLDVMLPGFDGLEVCRRVQADRPVPVLMVTARDDESDVLIGLGVGADDYLTKPFSMRELAARVRVLLRRVDRATELAHRVAPAAKATITLADLEINPAERRVRRADREIHLTPTEFDLLACLAAQPHTVLSREHLLEEVWGWRDASGTRTVDSHVKSLRRKIGADALRTVHGVGYALELGR